MIIKAKYDGTNDSYLKWATQNLAVTASGKAKWNGTSYVIGDYFQWAASYAGYGITAEAGKVPANLVIYTSFTTTCTGGSSDSFIGWKDNKQFNKASAPYCNGSSYSKYTSGSATLALTDDVANIVLGGTWRMPTGGDASQFTKMLAATYWAWDGADTGYYVFKPGAGTSGTAGNRGTYGTGDDKTKALLFFPAAGYGDGTQFKNPGSYGYYWSSMLYSNDTGKAYRLDFSRYYVSGNYSNRLVGFLVRPVSD